MKHKSATKAFLKLGGLPHDLPYYKLVKEIVTKHLHLAFMQCTFGQANGKDYMLCLQLGRHGLERSK
ncbi:hypothetical protein OUZ56_023510 [Daphnia magna]|uniref:Uncharacterized protein n=1 Tax=Daphnia magna TaxID=35525 RepID=A0ABR0AZ92_9CRUS|nr:hypothetical protein OUZ56_023510 [Daphnia magna]